MGHTAGAAAVFEGQWAPTAGKKIVKGSNTPVASDNSETPLGKKNWSHLYRPVTNEVCCPQTNWNRVT